MIIRFSEYTVTTEEQDGTQEALDQVVGQGVKALDSSVDEVTNEVTLDVIHNDLVEIGQYIVYLYVGQTAFLCVATIILFWKLIHHITTKQI